MEEEQCWEHILACPYCRATMVTTLVTHLENCLFCISRLRKMPVDISDDQNFRTAWNSLTDVHTDVKTNSLYN